jgi:hypothetical protein
MGAKVGVDERRRGRDERVHGLERVEPVLPLCRAEHLKEVGRDLGQYVDRRRRVRLDVERLVILLGLGSGPPSRAAGTGELAFLRLALLLARQSRRLARASRSEGVERLGELGDLDRLEVLEEGRQGGAEEEVQLLDEQRALGPDDFVGVAKDLGDRVQQRLGVADHLDAKGTGGGERMSAEAADGDRSALGARDHARDNLSQAGDRGLDDLGLFGLQPFQDVGLRWGQGVRTADVWAGVGQDARRGPRPSSRPRSTTGRVRWPSALGSPGPSRSTCRRPKGRRLLVAFEPADGDAVKWSASPAGSAGTARELERTVQTSRRSHGPSSTGPRRPSPGRRHWRPSPTS